MATKKHIRAKRENARKSTGPKSALGRGISSMNAAKHGLSFKGELALYECSEAFADIQDVLVKEFRPIGPTEHRTVRQMARCSWDQDRLANRHKFELDKGYLSRFWNMHGRELEGASEEVIDVKFEEFRKTTADVDIDVDIKRWLGLSEQIPVTR